ncbi:MAG: YeeE/YedE family protein [Alphaproteobacteria bacterium]|nr:YeeE/YedE family protein [Alphaproteobacteria bacterium]
MKIVTAYIIGLIFGLGISISGMSNPAKVLNFFDLAGSWDGSLGLVMAAALIVAFVGYKLVFAQNKPIFDVNFYVPANRKLDVKLLSGAAIFGIGWGISGFCPGGSLPAIGNGSIEIIQFTIALIAGIFLAKAALKLFTKTAPNS